MFLPKATPCSSRGGCGGGALKPHVCNSGSSAQAGHPTTTQCCQRDTWRGGKHYLLLLQNYPPWIRSETSSLRKFHASDCLAIYFSSISNCKILLGILKAETGHRVLSTILLLLDQVLFYRGWLARAHSVLQSLKFIRV